METRTAKIPAPVLQTVVEDIFCAVGVPDADAHLIADHLVRADLRGVVSHGISRVGIYIERLERELVARETFPVILRETPVSALVDGKNGSGIVVAHNAMNLAIDKATENGIGVVGVRGSNHCGMLAYYTLHAAAQGLLSLAMTNAPANMAPWGGRDRFFGTNPLSYGIPGGEEMDIVFDMAVSHVSRGKVILAAKEGRSIPVGWAIDTEGKDTTDPHDGLEGLVLPLGGAKGSGLAFLVEVVSAVLSGADFGPHLAPLYDEEDRQQDVGHFFLSLRPDLFLSHGEFESRVTQLVHEMRQVRVADGAERIYLPGEIELIEEEHRSNEGIPVSSEILGELQELADRLNTPSAKDLCAYADS